MDRILNFELVPEMLFYRNLRYILPNWQDVSDKVCRTKHCLICGRYIDRYELEAHEVWHYDDAQHIQYIKDIISVCKECHQAIHIGSAGKQGCLEEALKWYSQVNHIDIGEAKLDRISAFAQWHNRNKYTWTQDINMLEKLKDIIGIPDYDEIVENRHYISVPYKEKDEAKKLGAQWDMAYDMWYYERKEDKDKFEKWIPFNRILK